MENISKGKILVVDDTPATIGILSETLESDGFQVFIASSGEKAIQRAETIKPDIILLDVLMPGLDGFETCERLKCIESIKDVPILFMTGLSAIENKVKGFQAGAVDYVTKPIELDEVLSRIKTHIALKNAKHLLQEKNSQLENEIHDRKLAEAKVYELNSNLERRVLERTDELANVNRMLKMLSECNQTLVRAVTQDELFHRICEIITRFGGYPIVRIGIFKDDSYKNVFIPAEMSSSQQIDSYDITIAESEFLELDKAGFFKGEFFISSVVWPHIKEQLASQSKNVESLQSYISLPLIVDKKLFGYLKIFSEKENAFHIDEVILLRELAGDLAFGIKFIKDRIELEDRDKKLRENKILFEQVSAQSQVVIWSLNQNGIFNFVSETCEEVWGFTPDEIIGKMNYLDLFQDEDKEQVKNFARVLIETRKTIHDNIYKILKKDKEIIWISLSAFPTYNNQNEFSGYMGSIVNITERKRMIDELIEAKKTAEEANKLKDSLLSNMSHEFRTPLNGILGFAQLLEDELSDASNKEMVKKITRSGKRLMNTLNAVLTLTELERKDFKVNPTNTDIIAICQQVHNSFIPLADEKKINLNLDFEMEELNCSVDESLLKKIIIYLVDNAIKYTSTGEVKIIVKRNFEDFTPKLDVIVKDTGIGINEENRAIIFQEFRQVSEGYKRTFEGIGLGLSLSQKIAHLMGAELTFNSTVNVGSEFTISLPFIEPTNERPFQFVVKESVPKDINTSTSNYEIMLVEDNLLNIEVIKRFLKKKGTLTYSQDGREAIELAAKNNYDIFLIDINLSSDIDGIEVLKELKAIEKYKDTPTVAITGYASETSKQEFLSKGFSRYLAKPFDKKDLITVVDELMEEVSK